MTFKGTSVVTCAHMSAPATRDTRARQLHPEAAMRQRRCPWFSDDVQPYVMHCFQCPDVNQNPGRPSHAMSVFKGSFHQMTMMVMKNQMAGWLMN